LRQEHQTATITKLSLNKQSFAIIEQVLLHFPEHDVLIAKDDKVALHLFALKRRNHAVRSCFPMNEPLLFCTP
jgi:hypothetical protein